VAELRGRTDLLLHLDYAVRNGVQSTEC